MSVTLLSPSEVSLAARRRVFVLAEDRLGHYPEFREYVARSFHLTPADADGGPPGYFRAPSGREYEVIFTSRSGHRFPSGLEVYALVTGFSPVDHEAVDEDLWHFLRWLVAGVGGEWSLDALESTGALYKVPWARRAPRESPGH